MRRESKRLDISAAAIHAYNTRTRTYQDLVSRFDVGNHKIRVAKLHAVGDEDMESSAGSRVSGFDFANVVFLPDGRLVTSFADAAHRPPSVAVELPQKAR